MHSGVMARTPESGQDSGSLRYGAEFMGEYMKLNAPKVITFLVSLILVVLALVGFLSSAVPILKQYQFWLAIAGYAVLAAGVTMKGL